MSDEKLTKANIEFFKSAILAPALHSPGDMAPEFGPVESVHWALLGAQIGFLNPQNAFDLIGHSENVFEAWTRLREQFPELGEWLTVITEEAAGKPVLNWTLLDALTESTELSQILQNALRTFLLLVNENIFDEDSTYFLYSIGWAPDGEWNAQKDGLNFVTDKSVARIRIGFSNVWNYWNEMESLSEFLQLSENEIMLSELFGVGDKAARASDTDAVRHFIQRVRSILAPRFNLGNPAVVERYFSLAGELVALVREDTAEWLDARISVFNRMRQLITYAGGEQSLTDRIEGLWRSFTESDATTYPWNPAISPDVQRERRRESEPPTGSASF
jgi:hypothetical protein